MGKETCGWAKKPLDIEYHDKEWGVPLHDDDKLFEFLVLEGFQAGLSWSTILNKRENFRLAFDNFDYDSNSDTVSLDAFVHYLFKTTVAREATSEELKLFRDHMIESRDGKQLFHYEFNMFVTYDDDAERQASKREEYKRNIAFIVLEYISRLDVTYKQREVQ